jgi:hypothetical protein
MLRRLLSAGLIAVLCAALLAMSDGEHTTYGAPFALGPSGGDDSNVVQTEEDGRVTVVRAYPSPGGISCVGRAGYARLEVRHTTHVPVDEVQIAFTEAAVDPYTFVIADARTADGTFVGSSQRRGLITGDDTLTVAIDWPDALRPGDGEAPEPVELVIQFGLQLSGACPSMNAGSLRFTTVTVHDAPLG